MKYVGHSQGKNISPLGGETKLCPVRNDIGRSSVHLATFEVTMRSCMETKLFIVQQNCASIQLKRLNAKMIFGK